MFTKATFVWLLLTVNLHMRLQRARVRCTIVTLLALVGLYSIVFLHVFSQKGRINTGILTLGAEYVWV